MKKIFAITSNVLIVILFLSTSISSVMAQTNVTPDELFHNFKYTDEAHKNTESKIQYVSGLPQGSWQEILGSIIKFILTISGTLAFASFAVSGVMMVVAQGEDDKLTKAKHMLLWSVGALAIIAASYAFVLGISQLNFFGGT